MDEEPSLPEEMVAAEEAYVRWRSYRGTIVERFAKLRLELARLASDRVTRSVLEPATPVLDPAPKTLEKPAACALRPKRRNRKHMEDADVL